MNEETSSNLGYLYEFYAVQVVSALFRSVPLSLSGWIVKRLADLYFVCSPKRRNIALGNLTRVYGDTLSADRKRIIARKSFENQALSILELFVVNKMKKDSSRRFAIMGQQHLDAAMSRGKGVVFVASHLGAWEYIGFPGYLKQFPHAVIIKNLKNPYLNKTINALRRETDTVSIPKGNAIRQCLAELRHNHGVAIVIDQWAGKEGIWVDCLGTATSTTSLPARLAQRTGCALVQIVCIRKDLGQYEVHMFPEVRIPHEADWEIRTTRCLNEMLETQIRTYPEQWSWNHRRWRPQPQATGAH